MTPTLWLSALQILALVALVVATVKQIRATRQLRRAYLELCRVLVSTSIVVTAELGDDDADRGAP